MKVHVKKVPKKRMTERKKMSGTYSQEWERTPMNLGRRRLCLREKKNCFKSFKIRRGSNPSQFAVLQPESIVVDVFSSTGPQFAAPLFGVVLIVCPAFDCFQAVVLCPEKICLIHYGRISLRMVVLTGTSGWADPEQCRWGLHSHSAPPLWSRQGQSPCALWRSCPFLKKMQWLQVACFMKLTEQLWQWLLDEDDANQCGKGFFCESDTKPSFWSLDLVGSLVEKPTSWNIWQWPNHPQQRL